jgi:curved DNA-binding protein CbpA
VADYYSVLRLGNNATRKDIDQAYERLIKESKYDTTIDRALVEKAHRILSDIATKAQYDARRVLKEKREKRVQTEAWRNQKGVSVQSVLDWFTIRHLSYVLVLSFLLMILFYSFRFGYKLKEFHAGDVIYDKATNSKYGKIVRVEDHSFGGINEKAYQIQLESSQFVLGAKNRTVWLPQDVVKGRCYKKSEDQD